MRLRPIVVASVLLVATLPAVVVGTSAGAAPSGGGVTGISGTVTASAGGAGLGNVFVQAYDANDNGVAQAETASDGTYTLTGMPASAAGYSVCFSGANAAGGSSTTGYADQCYQNVAWDGSYPPPSAATEVPVSSGATASGIDVALDAAGAISGRVTAAASRKAVPNVGVQIYDATGTFVSGTETASDGRYTATGLTPSTAGYTVCFDASGASGSYADQCYLNIPWNESQGLPAGTTAVPVSAGATATGIDDALGQDGAIAGRVTAAKGGKPLDNVNVTVFDSGGGYVTQLPTAANGRYVVTGLPPSAAGYAVCFDATSATGGSSMTGYADQCYQNVPWSGGFNPPSGATAVPVAAGKTARINAALTAAGAISGTVTAATGGAGLQGVNVEVSDPSTGQVAGTTTAADGSYVVTGIAPSTQGYTVCFDGSDASGGASTTGYVGQCWKNQPFNPSNPPGSFGAPHEFLTPVPVAAGATSTGIDAVLPSAGAISGRVTAAAGGAGLAGVNIEISDPDYSFETYAQTSADGTWSVDGLVPSSTGYDVCFDPDTTGKGAGYAGQCWKNAPYGGVSAPGNATLVPVTSGATTAGISPALATAGAISGTVTVAAGGAALPNTLVEVFDGSGNPYAYFSPASDGSYDATGLAPSATGYTVCFRPGDGPSAQEPTGYAAQCYQNVPWTNFSAPPSGTNAVPVKARKTTAGVNAAIVAGGVISGTVTAATGGAALPNVNVEVFDSSANAAAFTSTAADGSYSASGLAASAGGYTVCFAADPNASATGEIPQCYKKAAWIPGGNPPAGAEAVPVSVGQSVSGIDAALATGGAISGTVTAASGGAGLFNVTVTAYDSAGDAVASGPTAQDGTYTVNSLPTSHAGYTVCFDAADVEGGTSATGYADQCFSSVAWSGSGPLPSGTTPVPVKVGTTAAGINASLADASADAVRLRRAAASAVRPRSEALIRLPGGRCVPTRSIALAERAHHGHPLPACPSVGLPRG